MTTPDNESRALLIKNLLNKAEAAGTTEQERDTYNAKAAELMIKWGIEEAMVTDADRLVAEKIVQITFQTDAPKSYSYETTLIGIQVAKALGAKGFLQKRSDGRVNLTVVGFEKEVKLVEELFISLTRQGKLAMAQRYCEIEWMPWHNGTDKFNWKRSFLSGYALAVGLKLQAVRKQTVTEAEAVTPGTELVLIDRTAKVDSWIDRNMKLGKDRGRRVDYNGAAEGMLAGRSADIGGTKVTGS